MTQLREEMLTAMENLKDYAAMLTGVKADLVASGWSEPSAEAVVVQILAGIANSK